MEEWYDEEIGLYVNEHQKKFYLWVRKYIREHPEYQGFFNTNSEHIRD